MLDTILLVLNFHQFLFHFPVARDPSKRRVKPTATVELIPLALESESEDSDFKLEDDDSSASDSSSNSEDDSGSEEEDEEEESSGNDESELKSAVNGVPSTQGI